MYAQRVIYDNEWSPGRSTYYTTFDAGNCGYGTIPSLSFPYRYIAAPNQHFYNNGAVCGQCYQIQCINDWNKKNKNCCKQNTTSITIQIVDQCPIVLNEEYCSGDIDHFDLSFEAFQAIADPICGVIEMQYRRVSCDYDNNIIIRNKDGINNWWYAIYIEQIAGYGDLTKVEMRDSSGDGVWHIGKTGENGNHFYVFEKKLLNGFVLPFDIRITNGNDQTLTAWHKVTSVESNKTFDFGSNFSFKKGGTMEKVLNIVKSHSATIPFPIHPLTLAILLTTTILMFIWCKVSKVHLHSHTHNHSQQPQSSSKCSKCITLNIFDKHICDTTKFHDMCANCRRCLSLRTYGLVEHSNIHNDGHTPRELEEHEHEKQQNNLDKIPKKKNIPGAIVITHDDFNNIPTLRHLTPTRDK